MLVEYYVNINYCDSIGGIVLDFVFDVVKLDIVIFFVEYGVDVNVYMMNGVSVVYFV